MKVHNKHHNTAPKDAVYIGRGSMYGNPYVIGKHGTRSEVIAKYRKDLEDCLNESATQEALLALDGKDLVCFCTPLPCHGDVLIRAVERVKEMRKGTKKVELWDANPNCIHDIQPASGGGVKCTKCSGWFCY